MDFTHSQKLRNWMSKLFKTFFSWRFTSSLRNEVSDWLNTKDMFSCSERNGEVNSGTFDKKPLNTISRTQNSPSFFIHLLIFFGKRFRKWTTAWKDGDKEASSSSYLPQMNLGRWEQNEQWVSLGERDLDLSIWTSSLYHTYHLSPLTLSSIILKYSSLFRLSAGRIMKWGSEGSKRWGERVQSFILTLPFGENAYSVYTINMSKSWSCNLTSCRTAEPLGRLGSF